MKTALLTLAATLGCVAPSLPAAEQAPDNPVFIFATYYHCNASTVERADEVVAREKNELDSLIKNGSVTSWGWLSKYAGGEWLRAGFLTGSPLQALLEAVDKAGMVRSDGHPPGPPVKMDPGKERKVLEETCTFGEDYIWHVLAGSDPRAQRGPVAFSTYYVCDQSREKQADALVKRLIGPKYDELVTHGKLSTWLWAEHIVGGKYRRLGTMTAPSRDALIAAREALVAAAEQDPANDALTSICGSHQDYIWHTREQGAR